MARLVRGYPTPRLQQEGVTEPERDPQQEEQLDATEGKVIAEGQSPKLSQTLKSKGMLILMQNMKEIEILRDGTLCQRMLPLERYMGILWIHKAQGP